MKNLFLFFITTLLISCNNNKNPEIVIETSMGNIDAELYPEKAPKTVAAFLSYIETGLFKNSSFYRVVYNDVFGNDDDAGVIQGGIWQSNTDAVKKLACIEHESPLQTGLSHQEGTLSLARTTPGTANSEFFICIGNQTGYDKGDDGKGFAAFGIVTSGMDIVRQIHRKPATGEDFVKTIVILNIRRK